ncbi:MAG: AI-2E family transporter, partial [Caulobacteraceae bacterium]|nr:AI-2E family transporter [Caulobacter sp.]
MPPPAPAIVDGPRQPDLAHIYALLRVVVAVAAAGLVIWLFGGVLMMIFAAALLATILNGTARFVQRWTPLPFWASLTLVVLAVVGALVGLAIVAGPGLTEQATSLRQALAGQAQALQNRLQGTDWGRFVLDQVPSALGGSKEVSGSPIPTGVAGS